MSSPYIETISRFITHDRAAAAQIFEGMDEKSASEVLQAILPELAARVIKKRRISFVAGLLENSAPGILMIFKPFPAGQQPLKLAQELFKVILDHAVKGDQFDISLDARVYFCV